MARRATSTRAVVIRERERPRRRGVRRFLPKKIPLAVIAGLMPGITFAFDNPEHDSRQFFERLGWEYFGFVSWEAMPRFDTGGFRYGLYPLLASVGVHWLANVTGINRALSRVPYVEI